MKQNPKISVIIPAYNSAEHIGNIVDSVKAQSFTAFECVIINDGSLDNTLDVVKGLTADDDRFIIVDQENQGVGAARNKGIELARGNYLVFYDADDIVPANALASLHRAAMKHDADLVIGNMLYSNLGESHTTKALDRLTNKTIIHTFERDLVSSSSVCNKLFRRSVIIDNSILFTKLRRYEDFLFCLQFEGRCRKITGCKDIVYTYERRPYWGEASAMMHNDMPMFEDMLIAIEKCVETVDENYRLKQAELTDTISMEAKELYIMYEMQRSAMYCRFVRTNFIDEIYRFAWIADSKVIDEIRKLIPQYKKHIFPTDWRSEVLSRCSDLPFENDNLCGLDEMIERPVVTFAVSAPYDAEKLNYTVKGIYNQNFPLFEVFIREELFELLSPELRGLRNLHSLKASETEFKKSAYEKCRGRYLWFIDDTLYLSRTAVLRMIRKIEKKPNYLFVAAPIIRMSEGGYTRVDANAAAYIPEFAKRRIHTKYNQLDYIWINKLFNVAKLDSMADPFEKSDRETLDRFYMKSNHLKADDITLLTELNNDDVLKQVRSRMVANTWETKLKEEDAFIDSLRLREQKALSGAEKRRKDKNKLLKSFYRWATVKAIYPIVYALFRIRPVQKGKIIFVEPTQLGPTNSVKGMIRAVRSAGYDNILQMSIGHRKVRRKEQFKRELAFIKEFATAEYVFTTEALQTIGGFNKRKGTKVIQLWHGCGAFKKFGYSTAELKFGGTKQEKLRYPDYRNLDLITVSAPDVIWAYEEAMNYKGSGVVRATGISRTDIFYNDSYIEKAKNKVFETVPEAKGKKIILYAPTFRGRVKNAKAPDKLDIEAMNAALGNEYFLLIKHHPHVKMRPGVPVELREFARDVTSELTIDDLLCCTDICISDYSSLIFEFSLFEKPMIFFAYDLDDYNDWRGFYYDYDDLTPGPVVMSTEEIIRYIQHLDTEFKIEEIREFKEKFMSACDGHATERILDAIGVTEQHRKIQNI